MSVLGPLTRVCLFEDEQVALKKKLKEASEGEGHYFCAKLGNNKIHKQEVEAADPDKVRLSISTKAHTVSTALFQDSLTFSSYMIFLSLTDPVESHQ